MMLGIFKPIYMANIYSLYLKQWYHCVLAIRALSLFWINLNTTMESSYVYWKVLDKITYFFLNFNDAAFEN